MGNCFGTKPGVEFNIEIKHVKLSCPSSCCGRQIEPDDDYVIEVSTENDDEKGLKTGE